MYGRIQLPDFEFPPDIEARVEAYLAATGDELYDLTCTGGARPELAGDDHELLQIYAFVKRYSESGWTQEVIDLAWFLHQVGRREQSAAVYRAIEKEVDDPQAESEGGSFDTDCAAFQQGLMHFDREEPNEALAHFLRANERYGHLEGAGVLWACLGATFHDLEQYEPAVDWYQKALKEAVREDTEARAALANSALSVDDQDWLERLEWQVDSLRHSIELALRRESPRCVPSEFGLE